MHVLHDWFGGDLENIMILYQMLIHSYWTLSPLECFVFPFVFTVSALYSGLVRAITEKTCFFSF